MQQHQRSQLAIEQQAVEPEQLVQQDAGPEHGLERPLAGLVPKDLLSRPAPRPAAQQGREMQGAFRGAPTPVLRVSLIAPVLKKADAAQQQIGQQGPGDTGRVQDLQASGERQAAESQPQGQFRRPLACTLRPDSGDRGSPAGRRSPPPPSRSGSSARSP